MTRKPYNQERTIMNVGQLISNATEQIAQIYFRLPIDGREEPIYRERVYCYELYHQLRCQLELIRTNTRIVVGGEVDKTCHPLFRHNRLDKIKPDLLLHTPGDMRGNYVISSCCGKSICHSCESRNPGFSLWTPAFAGVTLPV